tara:strand:+ start:1553 stop:1987 length:435 start_codon:yes stop_codon:yes gene_type:complete
MELAKCTKKYWDTILQIRNENREGFGNTKVIDKKTHYAFFKKYGEFYYVCVESPHVLGFIGHLDEDIRVATNKKFQNKGVGKFMVEEFMKLQPNAFAKIKSGNIKSLKLFASCGFEKKYEILALPDNKNPIPHPTGVKSPKDFM